MVARLLKFFLLLAFLQCISGRLSQMPKVYGQDSAIIKNSYSQKFPNAFLYKIPVYKLINPTPGVSRATATPNIVEKYPSDLVYIARNKLGVKRMDQLPTISEIGNLLGTGNAIETIDYLRKLTSNAQGIALMKSYLESFDYNVSNHEEESVTSANGSYNNEESFPNSAEVDVDFEDAFDKLETPITKKPQFNIENGSSNQSVNITKEYSVARWISRSPSHKSLFGKHVSMSPGQPTQKGTVSGLRRVFARPPLPYHFPIPLRPVSIAKSELAPARPIIVSSTTRPNHSHQAPNPSHLNTNKEPSSSKLVAPHVQQLAKMANISPHMLDRFLQHQPKLAELAKRISRLPLAQQHSRVIDSQLLMAVKRALSQDEGLSRLLGASQALK